MNLGQLLGGAGVVAQGFREAQEAERQAELSQFRLDEQRRLEQLRREMLQAPLPAIPTEPFARLAAPPIETIIPPAAPVAAPEPIIGGQPVPPAAPTDILPPPVTGPQLGSRAPARPTPPFGQEVPNPAADTRLFQQQTEQLRMQQMRVRDMEAALARLQSEGAPARAVENQRQALATAQQRLGYMQQGVQRVAPTFQVPTEDFATNLFSRLERQYSLPAGVLNAVMLAESGGRPGQTSRSGAQGYFQFMPRTAQQYGVKVNDLESEAQGAAKFLSDMLKATNGDLRQALAAYNWGIGNVQSKGMGRLPRETQEYIPRVLSFLPQAAAPAAAAPAAAAPAAAAPAAPVAAAAPPPEILPAGRQPSGAVTFPVRLPGVTAAPPAVAVPAAMVTPTAAPAAPVAAAAPTAAPTAAPAQPAVPASQVYLGNPQAIGEDMRRAMQQRAEFARLAEMYQRAGMGAQYTEARLKLMEIDNGMTYLQGMQGLQQFQLANDPRLLSSIWSRYAGVPVAIQPRSDGAFNIIVNGQRTREGVSAADITDRARLAFDQTYRQQQAAAGAKYNEERFKASLEVQKEQGKQLSQMIREIAVERIRGNNAQALEWAKANYGWDIKPTGSGDGTVIIRAPGSPPYLFNPTGRKVTIDGVEVQSNAAYPISGLPSYGGVQPTR